MATEAMVRKACVIGAGPNGLAAAIVLAQAGIQVQALEAESTPGGAARTLPLTVPGFQHDFGSAVYPLGAGSPFFSTLPLHDYGLEWVHSPAALAHPLDDGTAVTLEKDLAETAESLASDGPAWDSLLRP
jgi:phytoene dehydrogenase-like protein